MKETLHFMISQDADAVQTGTFTVPAASCGFCLEYDIREPLTMLVFLILRDPLGRVRFQKQLSCSAPVIGLGETAAETSIGGIPGEVTSGEWTAEVTLFAEYLREMKGVKVPFEIRVSDETREIPEQVGECVWADTDFMYRYQDKERIYQTGTRWYKGDLHTHTRLSDGRELPERATAKAQLMGLDYYIATEHNVLHTGWQRTDVLVMPGVEITTIIGHANLFGLDRRPETLTDILRHRDPAALATDLERVFAECRERGWLVSVNHPYLHVWKWLYADLRLDDMDCLEIINDPTYAADPDARAEEANRKAVLLSDLLWADGYRVCAVGGSDSHRELDDFYPGATEPSIAGDPATWLHMDGLSERHVLAALRDCRSHVTRHCGAEAQLRLETERETREIVFGDQIPAGGRKLLYTIMISRQYRKPNLFYLDNGNKTFCEVHMTGEATWTAEGEIPLRQDEYRWIRFGAEDADGEFLFYANAVTQGSREHSFRTFGEISNDLEQKWQSEEYCSTRMER